MIQARYYFKFALHQLIISNHEVKGFTLQSSKKLLQQHVPTFPSLSPPSTWAAEAGRTQLLTNHSSHVKCKPFALPTNACPSSRAIARNLPRISKQNPTDFCSLILGGKCTHSSKLGESRRRPFHLLLEALQPPCHPCKPWTQEERSGESRKSPIWDLCR